MSIRTQLTKRLGISHPVLLAPIRIPSHARPDRRADLTERMQPIASAELTLEPLRVAHAEALFELLSDAEIYRYLDYPPPPSLEHLRAVYAKLEARTSPDGAEIWLNWVVCPHDHPPVGFVQATIDSRKTAFVAYILGRKYWSHGYAQNAVQAMLEHLACAYGVGRFRATVEADNQRSIRLLERLGFHLSSTYELEGHSLAPTERMYVR